MIDLNQIHCSKLRQTKTLFPSISSTSSSSSLGKFANEINNLQRNMHMMPTKVHMSADR